MNDLMATVVAEVKSHWVDFTIYQITGFFEGEIKGVYDKPCYGDDFKDCLTDVPVFIHGAVKWDGCSNWDFDFNDDVLWHQCDRDGLLSIGKILVECWDITARLLPTFDAEIAT
jgi:hypothetical protein